MTKLTPSSPPAAPGLSTPADIEALADQLSAIADEIHARVVKSVKAHGGKPVPEAEQAAARALIDQELELRQRASGLHADAALLVVHSLGKSQAHVLALTAQAAERIRKIAYIGQVTGLVASVLGLAAAAASAQPVAIIGAIEKVRTSIKGVQAVSPPAGA
jgi:hypothetical protein